MIDAEFLGQCGAIAVSNWSDVLDTLAVKGVMSGIPRRAGQGSFVGRAVTVRHTVGPLGAYAKEDFAVARMFDGLKPGDVLVVDMGGAEISTMGGNAATVAKRNGAAAVIIDGGCRDIDEIAATGLWVGSRHLTPLTGRTRVRIESIGEPVVVGGVNVHAGDIVLGDDTGILVMRPDLALRALAHARQMSEIDMKLDQALKSGLSFAEAAKRASFL
ncbi:MAG: RraA family protein [Bauldia sp.]